MHFLQNTARSLKGWSWAIGLTNTGVKYGLTVIAIALAMRNDASLHHYDLYNTGVHRSSLLSQWQCLYQTGEVTESILISH